MGGGTIRLGPWAVWRAHEITGNEPPMVWKPCAYCWGQGRIVEEPSGDVYRCPHCLGVCQVPAA